MKKGYNKKKQKTEEKSNNKIIKRKRTKKVELHKDIQSNDNKRVVSLRSTNVVISNLLEIKGKFIILTVYKIIIM